VHPVTDDSSPVDQRPSSKLDMTVPASARIWNYWLGGKDNYSVDRAAGDRYQETFPHIVDVARNSRVFLARAIRFLSGEAGIRQFLDIGTGMPTVDNTHEVAQRIAPESRIAYVDKDPLVLAHARALLTSTPEGVTDYIDADLHEPEKILQAATATLDFSRPIGLMLMGIMGHVTDDELALSLVGRLVDALPSGSYLTLYDGTDTDTAFKQAQQGYDDSGADAYRLRSPEQIAAFFDGLELIEPGVVSLPKWRPEHNPFEPVEVHAYGAVARKP
jgi:hypothetical protein